VRRGRFAVSGRVLMVVQYWRSAEDLGRFAKDPSLSHHPACVRATAVSDNGGMAAIRGNSILPARREPITLHTADGLDLVGELALPLDREPVGTIVCLHPLPTHGGMMDSHLDRKAAYRLPALAGIAVLRFNTRGTSSMQGTSEGTFDNAEGEAYDVAAAIEYAEFHDLPDIWVVGWSFGTDLTLMHANDPAVRGAILLSPPLRYADAEHLRAWAESGKPLTALVPELDDYLRPAEAEERFAVVPQAEVVGVEGAKHLWVGDAERVLDEIVARVAPGVDVPLPREWDGPMETADTSGYADRTTSAFKDVPMPGPSGS
jgi:alpha/beta superfamily hydrolase